MSVSVRACTCMHVRVDMHVRVGMHGHISWRVRMSVPLLPPYYLLPPPSNLLPPSSLLSQTNRRRKCISRRTSSPPFLNNQTRNAPPFSSRSFHPIKAKGERATALRFSLLLHRAVSQRDDGTARHSRAPSRSAIRSPRPPPPSPSRATPSNSTHAHKNRPPRRPRSIRLHHHRSDTTCRHLSDSHSEGQSRNLSPRGTGTLRRPRSASPPSCPPAHAGAASLWHCTPLPRILPPTFTSPTRLSPA